MDALAGNSDSVVPQLLKDADFARLLEEREQRMLEDHENQHMHTSKVRMPRGVFGPLFDDVYDATDAEVYGWLFDSDPLFRVMVAREYALHLLSETL